MLLGFCTMLKILDQIPYFTKGVHATRLLKALLAVIDSIFLIRCYLCTFMNLTSIYLAPISGIIRESQCLFIVGWLDKVTQVQYSCFI